MNHVLLSLPSWSSMEKYFMREDKKSNYELHESKRSGRCLFLVTPRTWFITGLPLSGLPSYKFGFRSSVQKNGPPGEERHQGLVPRNDVLTNGFIGFSLARTLARTRILLYLVSAPPPPETQKALRTWRRLFALFEAIRSWESLYNFFIVRV